MIYAIGDIHGCLNTLKELLSLIDYGGADEMVFLGDYIDRGPDSKGVVDFLLDNRRTNWRFLRGNHEQLLLDWLEAPSSSSAATWLLNGGQQTLLSYLPKGELEELHGDGAHAMLLSAIPPRHRDFFATLPLFYDTPGAYFCHAGIDLSKSLREQTGEDLLWIRRTFIQDVRPTPKLIVHGHTPTEKADTGGDRINLDTGCVYGGHLTALRLPDRVLIQVPYKS